MSARLYFVVEGQTEETFVNTVLREHLASRRVWTSVHCVTTNRRLGRRGRGGMSDYADLRRDLVNWMRQEQRRRDVRFTTMIDLYGLPDNFPEIVESRRKRDPYERVRFLEKALAQDISDYRFISWLMMGKKPALLKESSTRFPNMRVANSRQGRWL